MAIKAKFQHKHDMFLRDVRPWTTRTLDKLRDPSTAAIVFTVMGTSFYIDPYIALFADAIFFFGCLYFWYLVSRPMVLPFKLPRSSGIKDKNNVKPGGGAAMADGILYLGNEHDTKEEIWFTNNDARTHILYLGTTGSGKTEGLKSIASNALCWGSGFIYVDGKADTSLWSTISAITRRFGRDDDMLIMNYMTGNSAGKGASNTLNPFSSGSASYLTNMMTSLMPDSEGDNAMWKERAVALISGLMPCLVWKRDKQNVPLSVGIIRRYIGYSEIIKLSRDKVLPETMRAGLKAYLNELPGYQDAAYDDTGQEKPQSPDAPPFDPSVPRQQHGYLSMQFTRSLQSLGDDYGYIFDTMAADVDMTDVVLQRRILVVLIPALEKSSDETANLGKIISSTLKGMMGATLGHTVEGESAVAIENKPTASATPFISIFDEVGYYAAAGMAVMAAQARSLGFCLVYAAQDLPAMEKRIKEEARSITANCNIKIFGKLEDPTQTKDFFEKTVGQAIVTELSGYQKAASSPILAGGYSDTQNASIQTRARASYDGLRAFTEGRAVCAFGKSVTELQVYYSSLGDAKVMRIQRFLPVPPPSEDALDQLHEINSILKRFRGTNADPMTAGELPASPDIAALAEGFSIGKKAGLDYVRMGALAVASLAHGRGLIKEEEALKAQPAAPAAGASVPSSPPVTGIAAVPPVVTDGKSPLTETPVSVRRPPPVTEEKLRAAGLTPPQETPSLPAAPAPEEIKGPLSWMDVIGMNALTPASTAQTPPPVSEPVMTWESLIRDNAETKKEPPAQPLPPQEMQPTPPPSTAPVSASSPVSQPAGAAPLSWADVIGASAVQASVAPPVSGQQPEAQAASPSPTPAATPPVAPASEGPMSWADVIGSSVLPQSVDKNDDGKSGSGQGGAGA